MHVSLSIRSFRKCNWLYFFSEPAEIKSKHISLSFTFNRKGHFFFSRGQQSSATMEQAAVAPATPAELDVTTPVSVEKTTPGETTETGKRKSDEVDQPETSGRGKRRRGTGGKKLRPGERYVPPPQKRNPGVSFSQEHFSETSYYFEGGLRKVHPYYFDFTTYCKGRWIGKSLLEVFKSEFRAESIDYYQKAAKEGRIRLNDTPVEDLSVVLKVSDTSVCSVSIIHRGYFKFLHVLALKSIVSL